MATSQHVCDECGVPATVHISDMEGGGFRMRRYCAHCADLREAAARVPRRRPALAVVVIVTGVITLTLSLLADWFRFGQHAGFGWQQVSGVVVGAVFMLLGAVARAQTLLIVGLIAAGLSLLADGLAFGQAPGFGWQQGAGALLGLTMLIVGGVMVRSGRSAAHPPSPSSTRDVAPPPGATT